MSHGFGNVGFVPMPVKPADGSLSLFVSGAWTALSSVAVAGTIGAKPAGLAGIILDGNGATGDFLLSLSPANLTAARRWSFPDRSDTVAGLGAQTFTGAQAISATLSVGGINPSVASVISLDSGATPAKAQLSCRANNAGSLACLVYDKDNVNVLFDIDYSAGFIARATTGFNLIKNAGGLSLQSCTGQTIGSVVSAFTSILTLSTTGDMALLSTTTSTSTTTGALVVTGGMGIGGRLNVGSTLIIGTDPGGAELLRVGGALSVNSATLIKSNTTLTDGAAAAVGTLTNAPTAGNPTKWVLINDNGTIRKFPTWT